MNYLYEKKATREVKINDNVSVGNDKPIIIAGPCTIRDKESLKETAIKLKELGVNVLRGGAFKPRKSPYTFQGLEEEGLKIMIEVKKEVGIPIITELTSIEHLEKYIDEVDIIQIGSKNMFNYELLKALGKTNKPILLKRSMSATYEEFLLAAEYIMNGGNENVILCERGIRGFETGTRFTLDIQAIPYIKQHSNLPIIIDPSHASGKRSMIKPMSYASIAGGADGLIIECECCPEDAICDKDQTIDLELMEEIISGVNKIKELDL